jgi:hypothetical protein
MGFLRTYFTKNNTILRNRLVNTAKNQVTELYYGKDVPIFSGNTSNFSGTTDFSRFIFQFDVSDLKEKFNDKTIVSSTTITHKLKMTNTSTFDKTLLGQPYKDYFRASSFDLILFRIDEEWDEGVGYDYNNRNSINFQTNETFLLGPSNFIERGTNQNWTLVGAVGGNPTILREQHFDNGDENLEMDITDIVNDLITGTTENYGFGIAFRSDYERLVTDEKYYVGFFTKYTQTLFEPHIETIWDNTINDDRNKFYQNKLNRLYLYSNIGGNYENINIGQVKIYDNDGNVFRTFNSSQIKQSTKGIYYVEFTVLDTDSECQVNFIDVWKDIYYNGIKQPDVQMYFTIQPNTKFFYINNNEKLPTNYSISVNGIKKDETILRGDIRRVSVFAKKEFEKDTDVIDGLKWRIYLKQGIEEIPITNWLNVNRGYISNWFEIDTSFLLPTTYYLDVKLETGNYVKTYKEMIKFNIVGVDDKFNLLTARKVLS